MRKQELREAKQPNIDKLDESSQKALEDESIKSKTSLIDNTYQDIEDFENRLSMTKLAENGLLTFNKTANPQNLVPKQTAPMGQS